MTRPRYDDFCRLCCNFQDKDYYGFGRCSVKGWRVHVRTLKCQEYRKKES